MVRHGIELCAEGEQITTKGKTLYLVISNSAFNNSFAREWGKTTVANYLLAELTDLTWPALRRDSKRDRKSVGWSVSKSVSPSVCLSVSQSVSQSASKSVSQ